MTERSVPDADYCPHCGRDVESAEAVTLSDEMSAQGVYARVDDDGDETAHLAVEGGQVRVYEHAPEGSA